MIGETGAGLPAPTTHQKGTPNTIIGPPTSGARVLHEFWRDALGGEWRCTGAGTPGTWLQIRPAAVTADPSSGMIPAGTRGRCRGSRNDCFGSDSPMKAEVRVVNDALVAAVTLWNEIRTTLLEKGPVEGGV